MYAIRSYYEVGWRGLLKTLRHEAPFWATTLPQIPRLAYRLLAEDRLGAIEAQLERLVETGRRRNRLYGFVVALAAALVVAFLVLR